MSPVAVTDAKRKIIDLLKKQGPMTAAELADALGHSRVAIRQHMQALEASGLVQSCQQAAQGRGRPSLNWELTELADRLFPDRHGELTVGILEAIRQSYGEQGLDRIIESRAKAQIEQYRESLPPTKSSLKSRVESLARLRTEEGYMAEVVTERPGQYLLIEHHCPICEAASCCLRLCGAELETFSQVLGEGVRIERTSHLLSGDERCIYKIRRK